MITVVTGQEIEQIKQTDGKVRGVTLQTDYEYVKKYFGEAAVQKVQDQLVTWDCPIDYQKIQALQWFPAGLRVISLLAIQTALGLSDEQIKLMGITAPKLSFLVKLLMRSFLSMEQTFKHASEYWKRHWTVGELVPGEYNAKEKRFSLYLKNLKIHPLLCKYEAGYFCGISRYNLPNADCREVKCVFRGDTYNEFLITWE